MAILKRANIAPPAPPSEAVQVDAMGGEVVVRGLLLRDRLALATAGGADKFGQVSALLAASVVDADGEPVWTQQQWEAFGARHFEEALRLFVVAQRLSGLDAEETEKN